MGINIIKEDYLGSQALPGVFHLIANPPNSKF